MKLVSNETTIGPLENAVCRCETEGRVVSAEHKSQPVMS